MVPDQLKNTNTVAWHQQYFRMEEQAPPEGPAPLFEKDFYINMLFDQSGVKFWISQGYFEGTVTPLGHWMYGFFSHRCIIRQPSLIWPMLESDWEVRDRVNSGSIRAAVLNYFHVMSHPGGQKRSKPPH